MIYMKYITAKMKRTKRITKKPERFADVQSSMNKGVYHGWKDTYQRIPIKRETLINGNSNYSDTKSYCGYKKDGFVVNDSDVHLVQTYSREVEEEEIKTDDEDDEEESDDYDEEEEESEEEESDEEESDEEEESDKEDTITLCINTECERFPPDWDSEKDTELTYQEEEWKKCCLCDGYFNDDGCGDILYIQEEPNNQEAECECRLCGKSDNVVQMKGSGQYLCGDACDDESEEEIVDYYP